MAGFERLFVAQIQNEGCLLYTSTFESFIAAERALSDTYGGRTVTSRTAAPPEIPL